MAINWENLPDQEIDLSNLPDKSISDITSPEYEEKPFIAEHPTLYGVYGAGKEVGKELTKVAWLKYIYPEERERYKKLSTKGKTLDLLLADLEFALIPAGMAGKAGAKAFPTLRRLLPRTYKYVVEPLIKQRKLIKKTIQKEMPLEEGRLIDDLIGGKTITRVEKKLTPKTIQKFTKSEYIPPEHATAEFKGYHLGDTPVFEIRGGTRHGSIVTENTLKEMGIKVPQFAKKQLPKKEMMRFKEYKEIAQNLKAGIEKGKPFLNDPQRRIMYDVQETIIEHPEYTAKILSEYDITAEQLADELLARASDSGRVLNQLSQIRKALQKAFPKDKATQQKLKAIQQAEGWWMKGLDWWTSMDRYRRMAMVSQLATAQRNAISQAFYYALKTGEDLTSSFIRLTTRESPGKAFLDFTEDLGAVIRRMRKGERQKLTQLLDKYPKIETELLSAPIHDVMLGGRVANVMLFFNRLQENVFRKMAFDARATSLAAKRGLDLLVDPKTLSNAGRKKIKKTLQEAVDHALTITFAKKPKNRTARQALYWWNRIPLLTTIQPFPRFWANSLKFLWDYNPTGFLTAAQKALISKQGDKAIQATSKAILGTSMLGMGLAIRDSDWAGPKWYLIKLKGKTQKGKQKYIDLRAFAPFSSYLFLAEMLRNFAGKPTSISAYDLMQGVIGINRIAGTGLVLLDVMRSESVENAANMLKRFIGEYFGGFSVTLRELRDFIGIFNKKERKAGSTRERPVIGPFMENIPRSISERIGYKIPEAEKITEPGGFIREGGAFPGGETVGPFERQITGITMTPKTPMEEEILRLNIQHIYPKTGDPELDRKILREINIPIEKKANALIKSQKYQESSDILKKNLIKKLISDVKREGKVQTRISEKHYSDKIMELPQNDKLDFLKRLAEKRRVSLPVIWRIANRAKMRLSQEDRKQIREYYVR